MLEFDKSGLHFILSKVTKRRIVKGFLTSIINQREKRKINYTTNAKRGKKKETQNRNDK